jgi:hypothetical protein
MKTMMRMVVLAALLLGMGAAVAAELGAGGGEPGKALLAHFDAIRSGDMARIRAEMHPDNIPQLDEMVAAGEAEGMIGLMQMFTPDEVSVSGGSSEGDSAEVQFSGAMDGETVKGTATLGRSEGRWLVQKVRMGN